MAKGGHARSGPAPDPNALRRDRDHAEWVELPAAGRTDPPPPFPLPDPSQFELELWASEWRRPQAIMWEKAGQELEVALFVRAVMVGEGPKATAADRNAVQRKMTDLGITVPGMRANRWKIVAEPSTAVKPTTRRRSSAKARLQVVQGGKDGETESDA